MLKIYICPQCGWLRVVSRRVKVECHKCGCTAMQVSNLSINKYQNMTESERVDYSNGWLYIHSKNK